MFHSAFLSRVSRAGLALAALFAFHGTVFANSVTMHIRTSRGLLSAINSANSNPGDYYYVYLAPGTYPIYSRISLYQGKLLLIGDSMHPENVVITAQQPADINSRFPVMDITGTNGSYPFLELYGVTIRDGYADNDIGLEGGGGLRAVHAYVYVYYSIVRKNRGDLWGSGLFAQDATLYLFHSLVDSNTNLQGTQCGGGRTNSGGGIGAVDADLTVESSTVRDNGACRGGGIVDGGGGTFTLENTTVSGNKGYARGGGVYLQEGNADVLLRFNTIANNVAGSDNSGDESHYGGGLGMSYFSGSLKSYGNILAENSVAIPNPSLLYGYEGRDCYSDNSYAWTVDQNTNMVGIIDNCSYYFGSSGFGYIGWSGAPYDPGLQVLLDNGNDGYGFTLPTQMTYANSHAIGAYEPAGSGQDNCPYDDERGFYRPNANSSPPNCDIGAIEHNGTLP
ncbi:MAG: hypothetical protein JF616_19565 [Fibrobacteres bacterium]|jgi:hypothetical protein|nr:hypothetical protein [Fibrobacterota bacterium]